MTKLSDIISQIHEKYPDFTKSELSMIIKEIFSEMSQQLKNGEKIEIRGFGSFSVRSRKASVSPRFPDIQRDRKFLYFRPGKTISERVNATE